MAYPWAIPRVRLIELCERAVRYRRSLVTDPLVTPDQLRAHIRYGNPTGTRTPDADGWVQISSLVDDFAGKHYHVLFQEASGRLRLVDPEAGRG